MGGRQQLSFALTWQRNTAPVGPGMTELLRWLGNEVGCRIVPRVAIAYEDIFAQFDRGEVDLAWLPPLAFLRLRAKSAVRTLLVNERHGPRTYQSIVAVLAKSRHGSLDKLQGARAAWVDPHSTTGYVLPLLDLVARGIDPRSTFGEQRFLGSHDAAARAVFEGRSELLGTFAEYDRERLVRAGFTGTGAEDDWRVLLRGRESPSDVLAARASLDDETSASVAAALTRGLSSPESAEVIRSVLHVDRFAAGDDARYAALADLIEKAQRDGLLAHL
jgi:phosphonate transport system substrate-binding protein